MRKSRIQFQKGVSLQAFISAYGTQEQCFQSIFKLKWPNGFICPKCEATRYYRIQKGDRLQCKSCRHQTSIKVGTLFEHSKLPLTQWFLAIYFISQDKGSISSMHLMRFLSVSYNTAWFIRQKLLVAMREGEKQRQLSGLIHIDDGYLGGKRKGGKRGRGSPGKQAFIAAISLKKGRPIFIKLNTLKRLNKQSIALWAKENLASGSTLQMDGALAYAGLKKCSFLVQQFDISKNLSLRDHLFKWINTLMGNVKRAIDGTFHALRIPYMQRYLDGFVWRFNRRFDLQHCFDSLIQTASLTQPLTCKQLRA